MRDVALSSAGLSKRYRRDGRLALNDVTIQIQAGVITALVGPNGAGKSTLVRSWLGFERPSFGSVLVDGVDPWKNRAKALSLIGYVPQGAAFYRALTVDDHVEFVRSWRPAFDAALVRRRLATLDIPLRQHASTLSGGQQAQLSLAIAFGSRAPILILDEPLASLDPLARREFMRLLIEVVHLEGRTVLMSSHVVSDVDGVCDRLVILSDGRVILDLDVGEVFNTHRVVDTDEGFSGQIVAEFPSISGRRLKLVRGTFQNSSQPSLEDVVMGYLAASQRGDRAGRAVDDSAPT